MRKTGAPVRPRSVSWGWVAAAIGIVMAEAVWAQGVPPSPAFRAPAGPVSIRENIAYGPGPQEVLDLCQPAAAAASGAALPAAVLIHGGNWRVGDKQNFRGICRQAALHGIVGAAIDYRLAAEGANRWPAQIVDVQLAIRWMRSHAAELHIDPNHICALGFSAGGHLAVFAGVAHGTVPGDMSAVLAGVPSDVACVVTDAGPVDLTDPTYQPPDRQLFGSPGRDAAGEREASPLFRIDNRAPPMLVVQGTQDPLVPPTQAKRLVETLQRNRVPVQSIFHPAGHGSGKLPPEQHRAVLDAEMAFVKNPRGSLPNLGYMWHN